MYTGQDKPVTNRSMAASGTPVSGIVRSSADVRTHISLKLCTPQTSAVDQARVTTLHSGFDQNQANTLDQHAHEDRMDANQSIGGRHFSK